MLSAKERDMAKDDTKKPPTVPQLPTKPKEPEHKEPEHWAKGLRKTQAQHRTRKVRSV
jgi:hypothetical protein